MDLVCIIASVGCRRLRVKFNLHMRVVHMLTGGVSSASCKDRVVDLVRTTASVGAGYEWL